MYSDIVTCRIWVPVPVKDWFNPVMSLMTSTTTSGGSEEDGLVLMRNTAQIRREEQVSYI
jgi:hypothetical protein